MLVPIILSGGAGTRLWPVSREAHPKPFMRLHDGLSLIQKTFLRASKLKSVKEIITITNRELYFTTQDEYLALSSKTPYFFMLEPFGRNTAPAIVLAALRAKELYGEKATLLILPADHVIENEAAFQANCEQAKLLAEKNKLVTFGINPDKPETGFGYIEKGDSEFSVKRFVEKPDLKTAEQYIASGNYFWNSGMFCFKASVLLEQMEKHEPALLKNVGRCWKATEKNADANSNYIEIEGTTFSEVQDVSIDYALMEKSKEVVMLAASFDWNDIGSWDALSKTIQSDNGGNTTTGETILIDTTNTFVQSEQRMVAAIGVNNLVIVDTQDALLVADRSRSQDVKKVVQQLKQLSHESYKIHRKVIRPWGSYTILEEGEHFKIKRIVVKPGARLSLQKHEHRSEHWVVVSGAAEIINGEESIILNTNQSTFVPAGSKHRLSNPGKTDLIIIEVQTGKYLEEDDIVRFEDKYGRLDFDK